MAKRYFDTNLHNKFWFRELPAQFKEAWRILLAECDVIGIWEIDMKALNFALNIPEGDQRWVTLDNLLDVFISQNLRVVQGDKLFVPGFIAFQYGDESGELSRKNKLVPKLLKMLKARGLPPPLFQNESPIYPPSNSEVSTMGGVKEEDKDKDKEQEKEIKGESEGKSPPSDSEKFENSFTLNFESLYALYPRPDKKGRSIALMREKICDKQIFQRVAVAIGVYAEFCKNEGREFSHILTFPNWWDEWEEWLDPARIGKPKNAMPDLSDIPWNGPGGER